MKEIWNKYHENIITFLLLGVLFLCVVSVSALFGGTIMKIFGFEYKSVASIVLFFIIATIVSSPVNLMAGAFPKVLFSFGRLSKQVAILLYIILDTVATSLGLRVVDYFMDTVSATDLSIIMVSFIFTLPGIKDIDKKPKGVK